MDTDFVVRYRPVKDMEETTVPRRPAFLLFEEFLSWREPKPYKGQQNARAYYWFSKPTGMSSARAAWRCAFYRASTSIGTWRRSPSSSPTLRTASAGVTPLTSSRAASGGRTASST